VLFWSHAAGHGVQLDGRDCRTDRAMHAEIGYEIVDKQCRNSPLQTTDALCYEPIGWFGKLSLKLERLLGMAQSLA
jgi:hypothetical protein